MTILDLGTYFALLSLIVAGMTSVLTSLKCIRELSSFDLQVTRIESLVRRLNDRLQRMEGGGQ